VPRPAAPLRAADPALELEADALDGGQLGGVLDVGRDLDALGPCVLEQVVDEQRLGGGTDPG
jgi:hypothetical protein